MLEWACCNFVSRGQVNSRAALGTGVYGDHSPKSFSVACLSFATPKSTFSSKYHCENFFLKQKPPHGFQKKMKLEVVDKRNPVFIRVATVAETDEHRIKVSVLCCGLGLPE